MDGICGTSGALRQNSMLQTFRENPIAFRRVMQHRDTLLRMWYIKALEVQLFERCFTILEDAGHPHNIHYFWDFDLTYDALDYLIIDGNHELLLHNNAKTFHENDSLNNGEISHRYPLFHTVV